MSKKVSGGKSAIEYAALMGMPRWLNFNTPAPTPPPAAPVPAPPAPPADSANPKYVTEEQFNSVLSRLDGISGKISGLERSKPAPTTPPPADPTLTERVKTIEAQSTKLRERERLSAIKTALIDGGVPAKKAEREARLILMDHGSKILVDEDSFSVTYRESDDKATPITDWVGAFLKTDDGKLLVPPKQTNGAVEGSSGGSQGAKQPHPFLKLTYKEIMDHKDYSARQLFVKQYPEEWAEKKKAR